jgi:NinB protein
MTDRADLTLSSPAQRATAHRWIDGLPAGTRVTFKGPKRTLEQNDCMWAMLTDIARQKTLNGRRWSTGQWKVIFLEALGRETAFIPSLDGKFIPYGQSSSDLSVEEMSNLIEFMFAWGAENNVRWTKPAVADPARDNAA